MQTHPIEIDKDRLAQTFFRLVKIDSISKEEGDCARWLKAHLEDMGFETYIDHAGQKVGGNTGNLIANLTGNRPAAPLLLSAHMDTVEPGRGIQPVYREGVISSEGETILGADDKSAIAIILEVMRCLQEQKLDHGPLEVVFSICEEVGLLGAKNLDYSQISAQMGYVLDTSNPGAIITRAPSANQLVFRIHGKAAHAGGSPEKGINAISLAGKAIAQLVIGRIDHETTCNIGLIEGGLATNIVPALVSAKGEVRSHDEAKLEQVTRQMVATFEEVVESHSNPDRNSVPRLEVEVQREFDRLHIDENHPVVQLARKAAGCLDESLELASSGGGSDANVFATRGISTVVLGTGMRNVHTVDESICPEDMARTARLLLEIILQHGMS